MYNIYIYIYVYTQKPSVATPSLVPIKAYDHVLRAIRPFTEYAREMLLTAGTRSCAPASFRVLFVFPLNMISIGKPPA